MSARMAFFKTILLNLEIIGTMLNLVIIDGKVFDAFFDVVL